MTKNSAEGQLAYELRAERKFDLERSYPRNSFRGLISRRRFCSTYFLYFIYSSGKLVCPRGARARRATESLFFFFFFFFSRIRADARPPIRNARPYPAGFSLNRLSLTGEQKIDYPSCVSQRIALDCRSAGLCSAGRFIRPYCNIAAELHAIGHLVENVCPVIAVYSQ